MIMILTIIIDMGVLDHLLSTGQLLRPAATGVPAQE